MSPMLAASNQAPGTMLVRLRATMFFQNQAVSRSKACIRSNQPTKMPAKIGMISAHRNGLLLAQDEHSISQPTVGSAQRAYTGIEASRCAQTFSGLAGTQSRVYGLPPCSSTTRL